MMRLLIVDGHAYAYRAFHAIRSLKSPAGSPTNAIFGFIKMLGKLRARLQPSHLVVVWDGGLDVSRTAALPGYKAQRPEMPGDLATQIDEIESYLKASGICSVCISGVEADDYIAGVAQQAAAEGCEAVIASSDKDFMQLVGPGIGLINPSDKTETIWGAEEVRVKSGVQPGQIVDWLALMGDSVDNIPGVPGVGVKTAAELLLQFGSVDRIYAQLDEVKSERIRAALAASAADVRRNQELVRLKGEMAGRLDLAEFQEKTMETTGLRAMLTKWGFRGLLAELDAALPQPALLF